MTDAKKWQCSSIPFAISVFLFTFAEIATNDTGQFEEKIGRPWFSWLSVDCFFFNLSLHRYINVWTWIIQRIEYSCIILVHLKIYRLFWCDSESDTDTKEATLTENTSVWNSSSLYRRVKVIYMNQIRKVYSLYAGCLKGKSWNDIYFRISFLLSARLRLILFRYLLVVCTYFL